MNSDVLGLPVSKLLLCYTRVKSAGNVLVIQGYFGFGMVVTKAVLKMSGNIPCCKHLLNRFIRDTAITGLDKTCWDSIRSTLTREVQERSVGDVKEQRLRFFEAAQQVDAGIYVGQFRQRNR